MKTHRDRHDPLTEFLFKQEDVLRGAFKQQNWDDVDAVLNRLKSKLDDLEKSGIANSRGLDHFLQVAMAWITTYLGRRAKDACFRATVSLFAHKAKAILVKPCLVYPGRCQTPQPTISVAGNGPLGYRGALGQTWLAMSSGEILYCQRTDTGCAQYIPLQSEREVASESETEAALCIPLIGDLDSLRKAFNRKEAKGTCSRQRKHCGKDESARLNPEGDEIPNEDRTVLNIECESPFLDRKNAGALLTSDTQFSDVVQRMITTIAEYQKQRDVHRALEHCSTLLGLATNTLRPRAAYRALLREISAACDGADVTLHLRDLFDTEYEDRCSLFVTGVGSNFRDFLINERIGLRSGQIGWALVGEEELKSAKVMRSALSLKVKRDLEEEEVQVQYIVGDEIRDSLDGKRDPLPFKQLMPNTFLNVIVPIYFHDIKLGVLNIEWDLAHLSRGLHSARLGSLPRRVPYEGRGKIEKYLSLCLPVVYRMADYFSLVIDYFDDADSLARIDLESLRMPKNSKQQEKSKQYVEKIKSYGALRKVMRYYMEGALKEANQQGESPTGTILDAEKKCLRDLVDAVGYFLAARHKLRILVSIRRQLQEEDGAVLKTHVYHWIEGDKTYKENRKIDIPVGENISVLSTCAFNGVPLFGKIEGNQTDRVLRMDELCKELLPKHPAYPKPPLDPVPYKAAGTNPRYEVGVPLVFGKSILGTFDFEEFEREPSTEDPQLDKPDLCAHLEWGRAIAFFMAYINDVRKPIVDHYRGDAFERFQALCAQLIAEVPVPEKQFASIATDVFGEIAPVKNAEIEKSLPVPPIAKRSVDLLRFRGGVEHGLSWETDDSSASLLIPTAEAKPGKTVTAMMTSYYSLIENLRSDKPEESEFIHAVSRIQHDLERASAELTNPDLDAGEAALKVFLFLDKSLRRHLASQSKESEHGPIASRYAWFLHVRRHDPDKGTDSFACDVLLPECKKPLAYCYTADMVKILGTALEKQEKGVPLPTALDEVLKKRAKETFKQSPEGGLKSRAQVAFAKLINEIATKFPAKAEYQDLMDLLTSYLALPRIDQEGEPSFTLSVKRAETVIVAPDINLNPNRSERGHGWFWQKRYTVMGIPFMLNKECVSVLNVFRIRDSGEDMKFFRIEERNKAAELAKQVNALLAKLVAVEPIKRVSRTDLRKGLNPLIEELIKRADGSKKLIAIESPFATSPDSFKAMCDELFFAQDSPAILRNPVRFPTDERSYQNRIVVIRVSRKDALEKLGRDLGLLAETAKIVFVFVAQRKDLTYESAEPVYAGQVPFDSVDESLLEPVKDRSKRILDEEKLYCQWLLGKAIVKNEKDEFKMLARCGGVADQQWTHDAFWRWLLDRRHHSETADFYAAIDLLRASSWRPDVHQFALRWAVDAEKKGGSSGLE